MKKTTSFFLMILTLFAGAVSAQNPQTEELSKLYNAKEFEKTIVKARELLKDDPQNMDYNAILGRALVDNGQYAEAMPLLKNFSLLLVCNEEEAVRGLQPKQAGIKLK